MLWEQCLNLSDVFHEEINCSNCQHAKYSPNNFYWPENTGDVWPFWKNSLKDSMNANTALGRIKW